MSAEAAADDGLVTALRTSCDPRARGRLLVALLGAAWGLSGRPFGVAGDPRYVIPDPIGAHQQSVTDGDLE